MEIQLPITSLNLPRILHLTTCNLPLHLVAPPDVQPLRNDQQLRNTQRTDRERVTQQIRRSTVDLSRDDARRVTDGLLHADSRGPAVVRRDVDVEPRQVQPGTVVHGHGAQEGAEELDAVGCRADDEDIAEDTRDVGQQDEGPAQAQAVGDVGEAEEGDAAEDVDGDAEVLGLDAGVAHADDDGGEEGAEAVEEDVLAELDEAAVCERRC